MGRGNWFPGNRLEDCRVVYVDYNDPEEDQDDSDLSLFRWNDLRDEIARCLPKSFTMIDRHNDLPHHLRTGNRDDSPLAYNGLFTLWCDGQGDDFHLGIGFTVNEDAPSFAASRLDGMADRFFGKLHEMYELRVRTSAWTSAPYKPVTHEAIA
jgi:hypothetical protein